MQKKLTLTEQLNANNIPEAAKLFNEILTTKKFKAEPLGLCGLGTHPLFSIIPHCTALCALAEGNTDVANQLYTTVKSQYEEALGIPKVKQVNLSSNYYLQPR